MDKPEIIVERPNEIRSDLRMVEYAKQLQNMPVKKEEE